MSKTNFKVGDLVELIEDYDANEKGDQFTVGRIEQGCDLPGENQLVYIQLLDMRSGKPQLGGVFGRRLKLVARFPVGSKVTTHAYETWGVMTVVEKCNDSGPFAGEYRCHSLENGYEGIFLASELDAYEEPEGEAVVPAAPKDFRLAVDGKIGTTVYESLEAAKEAALKHGMKDEKFSIFEVVKIADYSVKVTKELVAA